jgi:hypothetical protein
MPRLYVELFVVAMMIVVQALCAAEGECAHVHRNRLSIHCSFVFLAAWSGVILETRVPNVANHPEHVDDDCGGTCSNQSKAEIGRSSNAQADSGTQRDVSGQTCGALGQEYENDCR